MRIKTRTRLYAAIRWMLYVVCALLAYIIGTLRVDFTVPLLLFPVGCMISIFEKGEYLAAGVGLVTGLLIDKTLDAVFGYSAIFTVVFCVAASLAFTLLFKTNILNYFVFMCLCNFIYFGIYFALYHSIWGLAGYEMAWKLFVFPCFLWTSLLSALVYFAMKPINKIRMKPEIYPVAQD